MFLPTGYVSISNGVSNGRSVYERLLKGKITVQDDKGNKRIVVVDDGQITDNRLIKDGKTVYRIVYGRFERNGKDLVRFRMGSGKGKHGKSRTYEKLFGHKGVCHSWYKNGRLIRQKFFYGNGCLAYDYRYHANGCLIRDPDGKVLYRLEGILNCRRRWDGHAVFNSQKERADWFLKSVPFKVWRGKRLIFSGKYEGEHRVGEWIEHGQPVFYVEGVPLPKKLYETPPDKLDVMEVLKLRNAQTRMALMSRIPVRRIAEVGTLIHKQGAMRLYDIKGYESRILRVKCPTTGSFYFLNVPYDATRCEEARQWTFGVGVDFQKRIKFAQET